MDGGNPLRSDSRCSRFGCDARVGRAGVARLSRWNSEHREERHEAEERAASCRQMPAMGHTEEEGHRARAEHTLDAALPSEDANSTPTRPRCLYSARRL